MGTKMTLNYAHLFMVNFENKFIFNYSIQPIFYKRYIDDIFFISPSTADELTTFQEHLIQQLNSVLSHLSRMHPSWM